MAGVSSAAQSTRSEPMLPRTWKIEERLLARATMLATGVLGAREVQPVLGVLVLAHLRGGDGSVRCVPLALDMELYYEYILLGLS